MLDTFTKIRKNGAVIERYREWRLMGEQEFGFERPEPEAWNPAKETQTMDYALPISIFKRFLLPNFNSNSLKIKPRNYLGIEEKSDRQHK